MGNKAGSLVLKVVVLVTVEARWGGIGGGALEIDAEKADEEEAEDVDETKTDDGDEVEVDEDVVVVVEEDAAATRESIFLND